MKKCLALLLTLVFASTPVFSIGSFGAEGVKITGNVSWANSGYVTWDSVAGAESYNVYYKKQSESNFAQADEELILNNRCDLLGLAGDTVYDVKVVPVKGGSEDNTLMAETTLSPFMAQKVGYAFKDDATYVTGGYNKDGSVPENATIVYIDDTNKNTVQVETYDKKGNFTTLTGIESVLEQKRKGILPYKDYPLIIRIRGHITGFGSDGSMVKIKEMKNVTFEGIGEGSGFKTMGLEVCYGAENFEFKNLEFIDYADDGISICREGTVRHWVHNCYFGSGHDGACDIKHGAENVTVSNNIAEGADKNMLCGHSDGNVAEDGGKLTVTYANNYFKGTKQRNPRVRYGKVHVLNNYYDGVTLYGVGAACDSNVYVEGNYYYKTARPYVVSDQGNAIAGVSDNVMSKSPAGYLKAVNNYIDESCTYYGDAKDENLSGFNFEPSSVYSYTAKTPEEAKANVLNFAGTIRQAVKGVVPETPTQTTTQTPTETTTKEAPTETTTKEVPTETTTNNVVLKGDVNSDGTLTASDGANVLAFVLNSDSFSIDKNVADADSNGQITASDAAAILAKVLNNDFIL